MKGYWIFIASLFLFTACEENIFGPNKGEIHGTVINIHDEPIAGVTIKCVSEVTDVNGSAASSSATSDENGGFILVDVPLGENMIIIAEEVGYKSDSDDGYEEYVAYVEITQKETKKEIICRLIGNPEISNVNLSHDTLSIGEQDSLNVSVLYIDEYNNSTETGSVLLLFENQQSMAVDHMEIIENPTSGDQYQSIYNSNINSTILNAGTYKVKAQATDSDNLKSNEVSTTIVIVE
jgi:hypothetical protein